MKFYIVDCFAEEKSEASVAADQAISDWEQQQITREVNFSETAFIFSGKQADGGYPVRIWTPNTGEVPFAGHPTLGCAYVIQPLIEQGYPDEVKLNLKAGQITVSRSVHGMVMRQKPPVFGVKIKREEIAAIFGISLGEIREDYPIQLVSTGLESVLIPLKSRESLSKLQVIPPKFQEYTARHPECNCNHFFFTDMGDHIFSVRCIMEDFIEDAATGSANGNLAGYLLSYGYFGSSPISYTIHQGEDMGRKSVLHIHSNRESDDWLIEVGGNCHIVAEGDWR